MHLSPREPRKLQCINLAFHVRATSRKRQTFGWIAATRCPVRGSSAAVRADLALFEIAQKYPVEDFAGLPKQYFGAN
jgi:hypothetical protein